MSVHDDPVESGGLEDEGEGGYVEPPPLQEEPVEGGALEDEEAVAQE